MILDDELQRQINTLPMDKLTLFGRKKLLLDLCVHFKRAVTKVFSKIPSLLDSG